jgi:hypothetical protein
MTQWQRDLSIIGIQVVWRPAEQSSDKVTNSSQDLPYLNTES